MFKGKVARAIFHVEVKAARDTWVIGICANLERGD
jgi:hypothetical protein